MILVTLLVVPFITGVLCMWATHRAWGQAISYVGLAVAAAIVANMGGDIFVATSEQIWLLDVVLPWMPSWNISFHLGIDNFSYWLIVLTLLLAILAVYLSSPKKRVASYFASLNWAVFGVIGLFLSADAFLFFVFWELALLPVYWILLVEGEQLRISQILRFIVLTQLSGLLVLIGVVGLAYFNAVSSGTLTFDYALLMKGELSTTAQQWLFMCFLLAFLIKLPAVPFHGWMPALFGEGPASTLLVAILVKTSIFGLVRFSWGIFPMASLEFAWPIMIIGVVTVLYGAVLAFSQQDPRRILAYGTLSHAGLLLIGIFCQHHASYFGVLLLLFASALSTSCMLMLFERRRETNFSTITGLWKSHPKFSVALLIMVLASMGFPLFGNFVGEWLILWSAFAEYKVIAILTSIGVVLSAAYTLRLFQRLCLGEPANSYRVSLPDLRPSELAWCGVIVLVLVGLGLSPAFVFDRAPSPFAHSIRYATKPIELGSQDLPQVVSP